jgi:hypothetical protein
VLADELWLPNAPFAVSAAVTRDELESLWSDLGRDGAVPDVDLDRELVIYMGMSGSSSCPEVLSGLFVDNAAGRVWGEWTRHVPPGGACTDDLGPQGVLIAVQRELLPDEPFLLSLRRDPICRDCPGQPEQVIVDPRVD